jgi:ribosomal-protein-alanine N-acetyltransferase
VLSDPDQQHLIATVDGAPAGFVVLDGVGDPEDVELRRIVIGAEYRGLGLGRALLRDAVRHAYHELEARRVWLDVKPTNLRAISLYQSEGFTKERTITEALIEPDGRTSDLVVMVHSGGQ